MKMNKKVDDVEQQDDDSINVDVEETTLVEGGESELTGEEANAAEGDDKSETKEQSEDDQEESEIVVSIDGETPPQTEEEAPKWVRELRKTNREDKRRIKELEAAAEQRNTETKPVISKLGLKPSMADADIDYDTDKFEEALETWHAQKRKVDEQGKVAEQEKEDQQKAWQMTLDSYDEKKTSLKIKDFDEAEGETKEVLSSTQQGIILHGAENPALVIYALGKNPAKVKELGAITDPVKFAFAVAKLETKLKVSNRKAPPPPERQISGTGLKSGAVNSTLERLRAEASKTGDFSKVTAYRRQKS